jgi:iron complex outermembrane receptor protein
MTNFRSALMISASAIGMVSAAPALAAQTVPAAQSASTATPSAQDVNSQDIIVTAQKRTQLLIDVPQSITVISQASLEKQQASSFQDYLKLVPGLQVDQATPGAGRLILRGLNAGGVASTVSVYVDETPFGSSSGLVNGGVLAGDFDTFDVGRIEVLRGPQGTLYGASSLGGLLKFVTNAPNLKKTEARGRVAIESTEGGSLSYRANAVINVPLSPTLAVRASGYYNKLGGWIDSIGTSGKDIFGFTLKSDVKKNINRAEIYGGRASLLFKPSDGVDVRLTAIAQNIRTKSPSVVESDPNTLQTLYGRPTLSKFADEFGNVDYRVYNGLLNYDFGVATLTSSTSYSTQRQSFQQDATFNLSGLIRAALGAPANDFYLDQNTDSKKFTQEVRLASAKGGRFEWLVGGYYANEKGLIFQNFVAADPSTQAPLPFPFTLGQVNLKSKYQEYAGFANATVHFTDQFDLDFGGRYSHNKQSAAQTASGVLAGNVPVNTNLRSSDNVFTYSVAPKYKFSRHASIYARIAKGYRPGGPNVIAPNAPANTPVSFKPDTVTSYEVGLKGETENRMFSWDVAAYHIDWKNIQLLTVVNNFGVNINGASAKSDGAEFTLTYRPVRGLVASVNGAYTNSRLRADTPTQVGGRKGDRLPFTPPFSLSGNLDYSWSLSSGSTAFVGGSARYLSRQTADYDNTFRTANGSQRKVPAYTVVDLRAGVDVGRLSVEAFVRNLTNADGKTSTGIVTSNGLPFSPNGAIRTGVIRPRTIGLSLTASY